MQTACITQDSVADAIVAEDPWLNLRLWEEAKSHKKRRNENDIHFEKYDKESNKNLKAITWNFQSTTEGFYFAFS